jgi:hypothetical protein
MNSALSIGFLAVVAGSCVLGLLQTSCSADETGAVDAGADAAFDVAVAEMSTPPDRIAIEDGESDTSDSDGQACVPGERRPCGAHTTGCPTIGTCYERFGFVCGCKDCRLVLASDTCSWTLEGESLMLGASQVEQSDDGGTRSLSALGEAGACGGFDGYFATASGRNATITLCPASCQKNQSGAASYSLRRTGCPPT